MWFKFMFFSPYFIIIYNPESIIKIITQTQWKILGIKLKPHQGRVYR